MTVLVLHKHSSKYIFQPGVEEADVQDLAVKALDSFRTGLSEPDIPESDIVVVRLADGAQMIGAAQLDLIINPPQNRPVNIVTHTR